MFISVDLPLPDAPTRAINSPSVTSRSNPWRACTSTPSVVKIRTTRSQAISASCP
ncbi:hypothetical protein SBADM41S_07701 [Streptomyces badius]